MDSLFYLRSIVTQLKKDTDEIFNDYRNKKNISYRIKLIIQTLDEAKSEAINTYYNIEFDKVVKRSSNK